VLFVRGAAPSKTLPFLTLAQSTAKASGVSM
jgi:hypothetical protein